MKIKAYFPETFTISSRDFKRLEADIREKWGMSPEQEVAAEDILIEAQARDYIKMPDDDFMHAEFI